jgi:hypothetical protein
LVLNYILFLIYLTNASAALIDIIPYILEIIK